MSDDTDPALTPEDEKLVALARSARARIGARSAGAVRDESGRSYVGADVALPSLTISGLDLAVAQAAAAGATGLEAGVVVTSEPADVQSVGAVADLGGDRVVVTDAAGRPQRTLTP